MIKLLFTLLASFLVTSLSLHAAEAANRTKPNILFALADDWSYGHAGAYGCTWIKTPAMDRVAREGILFTNAYTADAKCAPSRACIITGRNPWQLKAGANHVCFFPPEFKSFPEALGEHGYFTGMTGKGWAPGIALDEKGQPRQMTGRPFLKRTTQPPTSAMSSTDYSANFSDFLDAAPKDKPWCFWYGGHEPHRPYEYGSGIAKGGKKLSDIDHVPSYWPDTEAVRNDMLDYGYAVEYFDSHLGRMLAELEKRGLFDNTLVIVASDNGMPFPRDKGHAYFDSNHLPLAAMWKGGISKPGRRVDDFVSFIDLAPTFAEVAGVPWEQTGMAPTPGRSLTEIFTSDKSGRIIPQRDHVLVGRERNDVGRPHDWGYPIRGILTDRSLYLHNFEPTRWPGGNPETGYTDTDGSPTKTEVLKAHWIPEDRHFWKLCFGMRPADELYDLRNDPECVVNLASSVSFEALNRQLMLELKQQDDPRLAGQGHLFDEYPHSNREERGLYDRFEKGEKIHPGWVSPTDLETLAPGDD